MPRNISDLEHLSYSSISSYLLCPRAWRFHYLDQIETPTSPALIFGSAFHETVEDWLATRICEDMGDIPLVDFWQRQWKMQLERNADRGINWGKDNPEAMNNLGIRMFSDPDTVALVDSLQPLVIEEQVQIERKVTLQVPGVPVPVIGYVDMIEQDGVPCDFKTSARSWSQKQANEQMQPAFYLAALNQFGYPLAQDNGGYTFRYYTFIKTKTPKCQIWGTTRTAQDLFWLFGLIADVWHGIEGGVFPPNPGTWKCGPRYCDYWDICRGGQ